MRQFNREKSNLISYLQESPPGIHTHTHTSTDRNHPQLHRYIHIYIHMNTGITPSYTHGSESSHTKEVHRQKGKMSIYIATLSCGIEQRSGALKYKRIIHRTIQKKKSGFRYLGNYPAIQMRTLR